MTFQKRKEEKMRTDSHTKTVNKWVRCEQPVYYPRFWGCAWVCFLSSVSLGYCYNFVFSTCCCFFLSGPVKLTVPIHNSAFSSPAPETLWPHVDNEGKMMDIRWDNSEMRSLQALRGSHGIELALRTAPELAFCHSHCYFHITWSVGPSIISNQLHVLS